MSKSIHRRDYDQFEARANRQGKNHRRNAESDKRNWERLEGREPRTNDRSQRQFA